MQAIDRGVQRCDIGRILQYITRRALALGTAGLGGDDRARLSLAASVPCLYARDLRRLVRIDEQDPVNPIGRLACLYEQGNRHYQVSTRRFSSVPLHLDANQRVKNVLKVAACTFVSEHALAQCVPVKFTAGRKDIRAEACRNRAKRGLPGGCDRARSLIGIDDRNAELDKAARDRALAGGDATRQANAQARPVGKILTHDS